MSKSYRNYIEMSAGPEEVKNIVANMVTDPKRIRRRDPGDHDVCSVYAFHKVFRKLGLDDIREECKSAGIGCVECKRQLADSLNEYLEPIRDRRDAIQRNPGIIHEVLEQGARKARAIAEATLEDVRQAMRI